MTDSPHPDPSRVELAEEFLRQAVYRSRVVQAFTTTIEKGRATQQQGGNCGLGQRAAIVLDLDERGRELFEKLWAESADLEHVHAAMKRWIERQDALDRKRNHFLKDFRREHGADRTRYTPEQTAAFEAGLARVNDEENRLRRAAADELLAQA